MMVDSVLCRACPSRSVRGFQVLDPSSETRRQFEDFIGRALDLIATSDHLQFRRVESAITRIVNLRSLWGYSYDWPLRICFVEFRVWLFSQDPELTTKLIASVLVHEATVGRILRWGVRRTNRNTERFDLLPCGEAQRFLLRLGMRSTPWDPERLVRMPPGIRLAIFRKNVFRAFRP